MLRSGSSVVKIGFLLQYEINYGKDYGTSWYRSKGKLAGKSPFGSYMMNKKWTLEEEFNNHMLRFQQVTASSFYFSKNHILTFQAGLASTEVLFTEPEPEVETEPLRMEHFYFPLGLWVVGLGLSAICLLAEIILKPRGNQQ